MRHLRRKKRLDRPAVNLPTYVAAVRPMWLNRSMRRLSAILLLCLASGCLWGQQLPSGTLLPAMLDGTFDSDRSKPGDEITAKLRQDVLLPDRGKIKHESKLVGRVVAVTPASEGNPYSITVQFSQIMVNKRPVTISTGLRAYATMELVAQSRQPANANSGNGTSVWDLNLSQIGGQIAYTGQKAVKWNGQVVGRIPQPGWVLAVPMANAEFGCAGPGANKSEQSFWVFSTNACGIYGSNDMTLESGIGGASPGQIVFKSPKKITVRGGSGWLLQVN